MKGCFRTESSTRAELMTLIYGDRRINMSEPGMARPINSANGSRTTSAG